MPTSTLKYLCESYYALEDHIVLLREQVTAAEEELHALEEGDQLEDCYRTQGVARYDGERVITNAQGNPTAMIALQMLAARDRELLECRREISRYRRQIARATRQAAPVRIALRRLNAIDAKIIELRFGQVHAGKRPSLESIAEVVSLDVSTVHDHLTRLAVEFPRIVETVMRGIGTYEEESEKNPHEILHQFPGLGQQCVLPLVQSSLRG